MQVLDMCAAPGSKTAQMMEMQHVNTLMPQGKHMERQYQEQRGKANAVQREEGNARRAQQCAA